MKYIHKSILLDEVLESLNINPNGIYLDCTLGGGGHSLAIGQRLSRTGRIIGIDQDEDAIKAATKRLSKLNCRLDIVHKNFDELSEILKTLKIEKVDGVLFDLGISSYQIDTAERGFSYMKNSKLDMRMDRRKNLSAFEVVNEYSEEHLERILYDYGEEKFSRKVAQEICHQRKKASIETTNELVKIIETIIPHSNRSGHPAKKVFQAIRIEVNDELRILERSIKIAINHLKIKGRLAVITFHSLEDRIVKKTFKTFSSNCICPKELPLCICNHRAEINILGNIRVPTKAEIDFNSRGRSAKLRVAEKIS